MADPSQPDVTRLLREWSNGDEKALEQLTPLVYAELHRPAKMYMAREWNQQTLETGALVNEAYLRLVDWKNVRWQNRAHFFGVSAQMMRRILVDYARSRGYPKRGGGARAVELDESAVFSAEKSADLVALDEALDRLAKIDEGQARVVELRFFAGLSVEETAFASCTNC